MATMTPMASLTSPYCPQTAMGSRLDELMTVLGTGSWHIFHFFVLSYCKCRSLPDCNDLFVHIGRAWLSWGSILTFHIFLSYRLLYFPVVGIYPLFALFHFSTTALLKKCFRTPFLTPLAQLCRVLWSGVLTSLRPPRSYVQGYYIF